ncbi:DNA topoisomerase 2-alpha-like [Panonychus citri]|uniref:DNA topoisomerase 2-alpha-like n=1 Tax=Panonychus citri TaxID=50023 RepID=UPI002308110B|nr:DNA topoisomerase 2-alpha-like [Panonychus citri]
MDVKSLTSSGDRPPLTSKSTTENKRLSVERIYQKKSQLEHILLRPDTYIGSVEPVTQQMWVFDDEKNEMILKDITYVPGLYKIFDEILVNAADNKQRDKSMNMIKIDIDPSENMIRIWNNGAGIPVAFHKSEQMYVPSLIFGHLLTSSNFNDSEKKVTGGRNGYGAKLCNVFSTKFILETSSKADGKSFKQTWTDNMTNANEAKIKDAASRDFTSVTFYPDLKKFKMTKLDSDIVSLFKRRAYDVAGSSKGVKVVLNGTELPVKNFKDYVNQYLRGKVDEQGGPLQCAYEDVSDRWQIAVASSDKGFQQVSFVNSIATTKGGRHVDHVSDLILSKVSEVIKKKNKGGIQVKPHQLKHQLWVFINCLVENPTFDSQTKENMTLQVKSFGSKCEPSEKFFNSVLKVGIVENILSWVKFKAQEQLNKQGVKSKHTRVHVPKLEDANLAGGPRSIECTLILTEGDSAKSLVVAGLGVIGRDKYGVFPLRGKLLNVREAAHTQIMKNEEIQNLIKIVGLDYRKKYEREEDLRSLRYGKIMIMTDQDHDGSHIKGLLINFVHHNWPNLLKLPFLEEFITPICKATKGSKVVSFYSLPEFEEWKNETPDNKNWKIKYYKGLGTSTSNEAKEYFSDLTRHRIRFKYESNQDDQAVVLAFSKKMIEQRKEWLTKAMQERKSRREEGLGEIYLYQKDTKVVTYRDFIDKELVLFSNVDNERSIPSIMDGLKPGQRKVMFTCFKRNMKNETKVAQLAGTVGSESAYHHGEVSLMSTIVGLAHDFVGSNNINLLLPLGQFGTRLQGGKDAASARYIFTKLSPLARKIFSKMDDPLLNYLYDDNQRVEPEWYAPILPMVLVNGADGIGTGWSTKIPNYNPRDIVANLRRLIAGEEIVQMKPWFKGYKGVIEKIDSQRYVTMGEVSIIGDGKIEITELPIRVWVQAYKENILDPFLHGNEKQPTFINDYKEYHTDTTVRFVVTMSPQNLAEAEKQGLHKVFKLQTTFTTTSMVAFDHNGCIRRYDTPEEILMEFYGVRLDFYIKRKAYLEGMLQAEALKLENQARFIMEKNSGQLKMEGVGAKAMIKTFIERGYDSDPVKAWQKKNKFDTPEEQQDEDEENTSQTEKQDTSGPDYDYLLDMAMRSMLKEKADNLLKTRDAKRAEYIELRDTTVQQIWLRDLDEFSQELDTVEREQAEAAEKALKPRGGDGGKLKLKKSSKNDIDTKPSEFGRRIVPLIDPAFAKQAAAAEKRGKKMVKEEDPDATEILDDIPDLSDNESDEDIPLSQRLAGIKSSKTTTGATKSKAAPKAKEPKTTKATARGKSSADKLKQTTLPFKAISRKSDEDSEKDTFDIDNIGEEDSDEPIVKPPTLKSKAASSKPTTAATKKTTAKSAAPKATTSKAAKATTKSKKRKSWDSNDSSSDEDDVILDSSSSLLLDEEDITPVEPKSKRVRKVIKYRIEESESDDSIMERI